jgi:hypothetical protein
MDKKALVKELQKVLKEIEKEKGKFTLVILARMKDQWPPRRFRFAAVALWIDEVGKREAIGYLHPKLFANPDPAYRGLFADATVFFTKAPLVQDILWEVGEDYQAPLVITNRTFDGIEFEEIILL